MGPERGWQHLVVTRELLPFDPDEARIAISNGIGQGRLHNVCVRPNGPHATSSWVVVATYGSYVLWKVAGAIATYLLMPFGATRETCVSVMTFTPLIEPDPVLRRQETIFALDRLSNAAEQEAARS